MSEDDQQTIPKTVYASRNRNIKKLTQGGYEYEFVDNIEIFDIECPFCCLVVRDAMQIASCGHVVCTSCWGDWIRSREEPILCPIDNQVIDQKHVFTDRSKDRFIRGLKVFCDYKDFGCVLTPELRDIETHMDTCQYQMVSCELMCGEKVLLWSLADHMKVACVRRILTCDTCQAEFMAMNTESHEAKCSMKLVDCDLCLETGIALGNLESHQKTICQKFPTYCNFAVIGCNAKVVREDLEEHHETNSQKHLRLINAALLHLYSDVGSLPYLKNTGLPTADDNPHELSAILWGKVRKNQSSATISWNELPECFNNDSNSSQIKQKPLCDAVSELVEKNKRAGRKIACLSNEVKELHLENEQLLNMATEFNSDIAKVTDVTAALQFESEKHNDAITELKCYNAQLSMSTAAIQLKSEKHNDAITELKCYNTQLSMSTAAIQLKSEKHANMITELKCDNSRLSTLTATLMSDNQQLTAVTKRLSSEIENLKENIMYKELTSHGWNTCPCIWKVTPRTSRYSPAFYTDKGYSMKLCYYIHGNSGLGENVFRVGAALVQGKNDNDIKWPWDDDGLLTVINGNTNETLANVSPKAATMSNPSIRARPTNIHEPQLKDNTWGEAPWLFHTSICLPKYARIIIKFK